MKMLSNDSRSKNTFLWGHAYNYEIMTPLLVTWVRTISYNMKNNRIVQGMLVYPIFSTIYFLYVPHERSQKSKESAFFSEKNTCT